MKLLCCYPDRRNSSPPRVMHFPFLKTLPMPSGPTYFDSNNRTLVCTECFGHFSHQWHVFESDGLALELRHYTLPPVNRPPIAAPLPRLEIRTNSPTRSELAGSLQVPTSKTLTASQSQPVSPGLRQNLMPRNRPVLSITPNTERRPPSSNRNSPANNPSPAPPSVQAGHDAHQNPGETSIYCYLCGLNSTRSFAHWLPSAPTPSDPTAPYFPYILNCPARSRAEELREDGSALVCTFCYHMVTCWQERARRLGRQSNRITRDYLGSLSVEAVRRRSGQQDPAAVDPCVQHAWLCLLRVRYSYLPQTGSCFACQGIITIFSRNCRHFYGNAYFYFFVEGLSVFKTTSSTSP